MKGLLLCYFHFKQPQRVLKNNKSDEESMIRILETIPYPDSVIVCRWTVYEADYLCQIYFQA